MKTQKEIDGLVLGYLYQLADSGKDLAPEDQILEWFKSQTINHVRTRHSLALLTEHGMIEERSSNNKINVIVSEYGNYVRPDLAYRITLHGLTEFERLRDERNSQYQSELLNRRRSVLSDPSEIVTAVDGYNAINWTKWGAIAAITAVPVVLLTWWFQ